MNIDIIVFYKHFYKIILQLSPFHSDGDRGGGCNTLEDKGIL